MAERLKLVVDPWSTGLRSKLVRNARKIPASFEFSTVGW